MRGKTPAFNIGDRVRWADETAAGTIVNIRVGRGGWPVYLIAWDDDADRWWSSEISCTTRNLRFIERRP
jgi:hypothetical protein